MADRWSAPRESKQLPDKATTAWILKTYVEPTLAPSEATLWGTECNLVFHSMCPSPSCNEAFVIAQGDGRQAGDGDIAYLCADKSYSLGVFVECNLFDDYAHGLCQRLTNQ